MSKPICEFQTLGLVPYKEAWEVQGRIAREVADGTRAPTLLLLEHTHTFTFGRTGKGENLLWDERELSSRGVETFWVDRGGDVTYHGPGQLVGYPLLPLAARRVREEPAHLPKGDFVGYLRKLEHTLINALAMLGVKSRQVEGLTGVWVDHVTANLTIAQTPAKIAAIGVKVDARGVSRHGFALNVQPDMSYWEGIIGCGLKDYPVTSLAEVTTTPPGMEQVIECVVPAFGDLFGYKMVAKSYDR